jgi:hypothetical protein
MIRRKMQLYLAVFEERMNLDGPLGIDTWKAANHVSYSMIDLGMSDEVIQFLEPLVLAIIGTKDFVPDPSFAKTASYTISTLEDALFSFPTY